MRHGRDLTSYHNPWNRVAGRAVGLSCMIVRTAKVPVAEAARGRKACGQGCQSVKLRP